MGETDLWYGTDGPMDAEVVIVGESWGQEEDRLKKPFQGSSGVELNRLLDEAGIDRSKVFCTNVRAERPQANETFRFFVPKERYGKSPRIGGLAPDTRTQEEVRRLYKQIAAYPRKVVIAAGNWSFWALSRQTGSNVVRESNNRKVPLELQTWTPSGIMDWRGSMWFCEPHPEFTSDVVQKKTLESTRLLPIIHPAAIMRAWYNRAPTLHDLKTRVPFALRNDWRPSMPPVMWAPPTFVQAVQRIEYWLDIANRGNVVRLAADIETIRRTFISCIGFADSVNFAMSIPFVRRDNPDGSFESYWSSQQESQLISLIRRLFLHPNIQIVGQNFIYDTQYIQHWWGVTPRLASDTMLVQNVLFPGTPKALDYLSSLYCHYHWYWKEDNKDWDKLGDLDRLLDYNCRDCLRTWEVDESEQQYIRFSGQEEQVRFKMQTNDLCLRMMNRGVRIDAQRRSRLVYELDAARADIYKELLQIVPQDMVKPDADKMWYRSAKQTATLFYDILGFRVVRHRKTGQPTVGKEALMQLEKWYPEFTGLFQRLDMAGSVDNSHGVVSTPADADGRMRCSYNPGGTETHRLSSSANVFGRGTNLQNLTKGEEDE